MAVYDIHCNALTGGASGALDSVDGNSVDDGSKAFVQTNGVVYLYRLNAASGAAESSPDIISPDTNAGTKRWILQGMRLASLQLATGATPTEFSTDGTLGGNSDTAVPTEKAVKTYVDGVGGLTPLGVAGYVDRPMFAYKDTDEIYIYPGRYHHDGTSDQIVYWDSQLTYQFTGVAANTWYYLYIDDSAIVAAGSALLTASEFIHSSTAPTYSNAAHGLYNGSDRCIGAFRTTATGTLEKFWHDGGDTVVYDSVMTDVDGVSISTTWDDRTLTLPAFATKALVSFYFVNANTSGRILYYRTTGSTSSTGHRVGYARADEANAAVNTFPVMTNTSQSIDLYATGAMTVSVYTNGYYFPRGM